MANGDESHGGTLNVPSLLAFAVVTFLAVRFFFFSSSQSSSLQSATPHGSRRRVPLERVDTIMAMFPQLNRRDAEWDLLRNGGSVQATSERVLREGRLPAAPPNFQASSSPSSGTTTASTAVRQPIAGSQRQTKPQYPDLITRYNLTSKLSPAKDAPTGNEDDGVIQKREKGGWSGNKNERSALLKQRREEMVLAARKKMEERDKVAKAGGSS